MFVKSTMIIFLLAAAALFGLYVFVVGAAGVIKNRSAAVIAKLLSAGLFAESIFIILTVTLFARSVLQREFSFCIVPFADIYDIIRYGLPWNAGDVIPLDILNILLFIPFGFFGAASLPIKKGFVILIALRFSLFIEIIQMFTRIGIFDINDIMYNVVGAALGVAVFAVLYRILSKIKQKKSDNHM